MRGCTREILPGSRNLIDRRPTLQADDETPSVRYRSFRWDGVDPYSLSPFPPWNRGRGHDRGHGGVTPSCIVSARRVTFRVVIRGRAVRLRTGVPLRGLGARCFPFASGDLVTRPRRCLRCFARQGYVTHAWGADELMPLTRRGKDSFELGLTIVSAMGRASVVYRVLGRLCFPAELAGDSPVLSLKLWMRMVGMFSKCSTFLDSILPFANDVCRNGGFRTIGIWEAFSLPVGHRGVTVWRSGQLRSMFAPCLGSRFAARRAFEVQWRYFSKRSRDDNRTLVGLGPW